MDRWVCLDVGETLIDETRVWSAWADELGITRLTFMAALGAAIARGDEYRGVFDVLGVADWRQRRPAVEKRYGGFRDEDLYPDARRALARLEERGYRVSVAANQPASRAAELRALGIGPDVLAMSDAIGVAKPDLAFFGRALELMGDPAPGDVAYVGDRIDNDVAPAAAAGMRAVWLRRGPWGAIQRPDPTAPPALTVSSLDELVERIGEAWPA
ncbi:MAG TPA: HAD family hydrolase [Candidatus Limnocylindria bacterium]